MHTSKKGKTTAEDEATILSNALYSNTFYGNSHGMYFDLTNKHYVVFDMLFRYIEWPYRNNTPLFWNSISSNVANVYWSCLLLHSWSKSTEWILTLTCSVPRERQCAVTWHTGLSGGVFPLKHNHKYVLHPGESATHLYNEVVSNFQVLSLWERTSARVLWQTVWRGYFLSDLYIPSYVNWTSGFINTQ